MFKIKVIISEEKKDRDLIDVQDGVHLFKIENESSKVLSSLAKRLIGFCSSYSSNDFEICTELSKEGSDKLALFINAFREEVKLVTKYVKKEEEEVEKNILVKDFDLSSADETYSAISSIFPRYSEAVNEPANYLNPSTYSKRIRDEIEKEGLSDEVTVEEIFATVDSKLGLINAVGKAAEEAPRLVIVRFGKAESVDYCLVGKGVCFDTGGLSLKPSKYMIDMHKDMAGSALFFYSALASYKVSRKPLICVLPLVENAISKDAVRVSDVIVSYTGDSVGILNTDAEGRLILADSVGYASKNLNYKHLLVSGTLTGCASLIALNDGVVVISDSENMFKQVESSSIKEGETVVRASDSDLYLKPLLMNKTYNIANCEVKISPDTIQAHKFIQYFAKQRKGRTYTHFDIANLFTSPLITASESTTNFMSTIVDILSLDIEVDTKHEK